MFVVFVASICGLASPTRVKVLEISARNLEGILNSRSALNCIVVGFRGELEVEIKTCVKELRLPLASSANQRDEHIRHR